MPQNNNSFHAFDELTAAEILALVRTHLPAWTRACEAQDSDGIALHESDFGTSTTELLLFACAIKLAASKGKNVYVACGDLRNAPEAIVAPARLVTIFREESQSRRPIARKPQSNPPFSPRRESSI